MDQERVTSLARIYDSKNAAYDLNSTNAVWDLDNKNVTNFETKLVAPEGMAIDGISDIKINKVVYCLYDENDKKLVYKEIIGEEKIAELFQVGYDKDADSGKKTN